MFAALAVTVTCPRISTLQSHGMTLMFDMNQLPSYATESFSVV